ncbi:hypothetical protein CU097_011617 [Rhizopus azygosporus]|uniref:Uncharacterized protein n=1 Tax=Rhizopus azygosporus TaxID=86630 RepID=A0A367JN51_RHIAZ|nr:hypothetical protein CU097_011617 [Rhizopus azygosporus]
MTTVSTWICFSTEEGQYFTQKREDTTFLWFLYFFTQVQILTICGSLAAIGFAAPSPQMPSMPRPLVPGSMPKPPSGMPMPGDDPAQPQDLDLAADSNADSPALPSGGPNPQDTDLGFPSDDLNLQYAY